MRQRPPFSLLLSLAALMLTACSSDGESSSPPPGTLDLGLEPVATGFDFPLFLTAPAGDARLFVVEKGGLIRIVKNGAVLAAPFLDVSSAISTGSEQGLLGLESIIEGEPDDFVRKGLQLVIDGSEPDQIRSILEVDLHVREQSDTRAAKVFEGMGIYSPTLGIIGAVLGLMAVMQNLADPSKLGHGIAAAFVATMRELGASHRVVWLSNEGWTALPDVAARLPAGSAPQLVLARDGEPVALTEVHGRWVRML